jgi:co-chaperonin GroES (HSP10)
MKPTSESVSEAMRIIEPKGYQLLVAMPVVEEKTKGGIFLTDDLKTREGTASIMGLVLKIGPQAYQDEARFPNGAWCKEGDIVLFKSYTGNRIKILGQEFRLVNDDVIGAVVSDPSNIERA